MDRLKLLSYVSDELYSTVDLNNVLLIACQHILGTTYEMFEEQFRKGLKPEDVFLIGKCYSTHRGTYKKFEQKGVHVSPFSEAYDSSVSFDEQFLTYIERFFIDIQKRVQFERYKKIIILDDGGCLLCLTSDFLKNLKNIVGIEQTSSGYRKLSGVELNFPVINVARSKAKLEIESPMIAKLVTEKIDKFLAQSNYKNPRILVIGNGYIGQRTFELLKKDFSVSRCDMSADKCDFSGNYKDRLSDFDLIVGATGETVVTPGEFGKLMKGVTLISASSSDREFSAAYLRGLASKTDDCHQDFVNKDITLLNGGFPINFDGAEHSLPREQVQFTRALLLSAVYEGMRLNDNAGIHELNMDAQNKITEEFTSLL